MTHLSRSIGAMLFFGIFLCSCDSSNNPFPPQGSRSVTVVDQGAVVPAPIKTTVAVNSHFIVYSSARLDTPLVWWSSHISAEDFAHLIAIVDEYDLMNAPDPTLPPGEEGCVGARAMNIIMINGDKQDTLTIPGPLRCPNLASFWPAGLDSLLEFEGSLVRKYQPY
jgi:hypothetical protein